MISLFPRKYLKQDVYILIYLLREINGMQLTIWWQIEEERFCCNSNANFHFTDKHYYQIVTCSHGRMRSYLRQTNIQYYGEQGWRSGESARLLPMCPGFESYVDCVCWFSTLLRDVFLRELRFSPLLKNQQIQFDLIWFIYWFFFFVKKIPLSRRV